MLARFLCCDLYLKFVKFLFNVCIGLCLPFRIAWLRRYDLLIVLFGTKRLPGFYCWRGYNLLTRSREQGVIILLLYLQLLYVKKVLKVLVHRLHRVDQNTRLNWQYNFFLSKWLFLRLHSVFFFKN